MWDFHHPSSTDDHLHFVSVAWKGSVHFQTSAVRTCSQRCKFLLQNVLWRFLWQRLHFTPAETAAGWMGNLRWTVAYLLCCRWNKLQSLQHFKPSLYFTILNFKRTRNCICLWQLKLLPVTQVFHALPSTPPAQAVLARGQWPSLHTLPKSVSPPASSCQQHPCLFS